MARTAAVWLAVLVAVGCGGSGGDAGGTGQPATREAVTGSRLYTYHQDDGSVLTRVSPDIDQAEISALVPEGTGYREVQGSFAPDGSFSIPDVGTGDYLLRVVQVGSAPRYLPQSARSVDLGLEAVGRPNRLLAALASPVTFSLSGLEPWATGGSITLLSTGARLLANPTTTIAPATGATSGSFTMDFRARPLPATGDLGWMLQNVQRFAGTPALGYTAVARASTLLSLVDMADGDTATLDVPVGITLENGSVGMDLRRSQFTAGYANMAPAGVVTPAAFNAYVRSYPRTPSSTLYANLLSFLAPLGTADLDLGTLIYARPFPPWFTEVRVLEQAITVRIPAALGSSEITFSTFLTRHEPLPGAPNPIVPLLGPARLPRVAGRDALLPQGGIGLTPTLSWSTPALGTPTRYVVSIFDLANGGFAVRAQITAIGTSVAIPPRVLVPGGVYLAQITAYVEPGHDLSAPNKVTFPRDMVPLYTAPFAP